MSPIDITNPATRDNVEAAALTLTNICHGLAAQSGWWSKPDSRAPMMTPVRLMLMVSELGEAMEAHRKSRMDDHLPHRRGLEVELADLVIRAFDMAGGEGLDLAGAIVEKLAYNARRLDHRPEERAKEGGKQY